MSKSELDALFKKIWLPAIRSCLEASSTPHLDALLKELGGEPVHHPKWRKGKKKRRRKYVP